jgi:hypothetical protein
MVAATRVEAALPACYNAPRMKPLSQNMPPGDCTEGTNRSLLFPATELEELPWRTEGLFSTHFLVERLPASGAAVWSEADSSDRVFDEARQLLRANLTGLRRGNEEDCEDRFLTPMLRLLGFGFSNRKSIPRALQQLLPDYLLYVSQEVAEAAFHQGTREVYYADCLALLEGKRWGHNLSEDSSGKGKAPRGRSPHYQIRDYLSESDQLVWGILTNGAKWRLYCKRDRASSFFEFDLEAALTHEDTPEAETRARRQFRVFHALFRREASARRPDGLCALDDVREGAQRFREEVERDLRGQVFQCVEILGRGFLDNRAAAPSPADLQVIYENTLILLYRLLFVLNAEARDLLPIRPTNDRSRRYYNSYSLELMRHRIVDPNTASDYTDDLTYVLDERLRGLFRLINGHPDPGGTRDKNVELDIPRYNGGLFDPRRFPFLEHERVGDSFLAKVLKLLCYRENGSGELVAFDYATLGERHLGSIYEGLLEYHFVLTDGKPELVNQKGERRALGAYYTPEPWAAYIVEHTLRPLLEEAERRLADHSALRIAPGRARAQSEITADDSLASEVLKLRACDPAMGSGHFLVEAMTLLAEAIAAHPTTASRPQLNSDGTPRRKSDGSGELLCTQEAKLAYWKRRVVESCLYGVDVNPLAVELAKLSLWLKTVDRVPLNFLDHHLRCGNSLIGTDLKSLPRLPVNRNGRPCGNDNARNASNAQPDSLFSAKLSETLKQAIADLHAIQCAAAETHEAAREKERLWREVSEQLMPEFRAVGDLWLCPWFGASLDKGSYAAAFVDGARALALREERAGVLDALRPFHWELEFPDVFFDEAGNPKATPGFDAVIGNPPWERIKLQENEFFAGRDRRIALAPRAADRRRLIAALPEQDPALWKAYQSARNLADNTLDLVHRSGFYPLMGRGDTNLYAVFAERALQLIHPTGRVGVLVPSGIATDDTTRHFFQHLVTNRMLAELLDFENREGVFAEVHRSFKFSIVLVSGAGAPRETIRCGFFLHNMEQLNDPERVVTLTPEDFRLFNPNTLTCPIFRRSRDAELTRKIYRNVPVLVEEAKGEAGNPWSVSFLRMFDMTNDSRLFKTAVELENDGFWLGAGNVYTKGAARYLPLYEGKMAQMYDHRAASVVVNPENIHRPANEIPTTPKQHAAPDHSPASQFWVDADRVTAHFDAPYPCWLLGYKDVTAPTNVRTMIAAAIPFTAVGNTFCLVNSSGALQPRLRACLLANVNSFVLDYAARQKVGGQHLNFFIVEQLPVLPPERYEADWHGARLVDFITQRVLELCYTAHDLKGFAEDLGYDGPPFAWDEERRLHLRCQLDALFFLLYGLDREEAADILDTFPIVRRQDEAAFDGRHRTKSLILGYYNAYVASNMDAWVKG